LDSTSVAASLRAVRPDARIVALAVPFHDARADERALQAMVAEHVGAELRWAPLDGQDAFCGDPVELLNKLGTPPVAPNHYFVERVAAAGQDAGIDIALDGIDGDGVVGGNWNYLSDLFMRGRWRSLTRERDALSRVYGVAPQAANKWYIAQPLVPAAIRHGLAVLRRRTSGFEFLQPQLRPAARRASYAAPWRPGLSFAANERSMLDNGAAPAVLEAIDETWLARGITPAHPFTDRRLIAYCLGLPREQKVRLGMTKVVLRNAMRGSLPPEVTERAVKAALGTSFFAGLSGTGQVPLRKGLSLALSNMDAWVLPEAIASMRDMPLAGPEPFRTAFLAIWRSWVDGDIGTSAGGRVAVLREAE
jgi:asparagine synthase (glutamine-hydrolysing)